MWVLGPRLITDHQIRFDSLDQRIAVVGVLAGIFASLGGLLVLIGGFLLTLVEGYAGSFTDRRWAYALGGGVLLVALYCADSALVHWFAFGSNLWDMRVPLATGAAVCASGLLVARHVYMRIIRGGCRVSTRPLAFSVAGAACVGAIVTGTVGAGGPPPAPVAEVLKPIQTDRDRPPLLFVGLDGASWNALRSEIENGSAPTLRRLIDQGTHGTMEALWPPHHWSGAAWAAILTGRPRETNGVYEDLAARADGLPAFQFPLAGSFLTNPIYSIRKMLVELGVIEVSLHSRAMLNGVPVWEYLYAAGIDTAVVRFRFTYPPDGRATVVVSDRVGHDGWTTFGVRRDPIAAGVTPSERAAELLEPFRPERPANRALLEQLLPKLDRIRPSDSAPNPLEALDSAADIDDRTFDISERILDRNPEQPFLGVYIVGLDSVAHAFWQYRFPDSYDDPPTPDDVARLGAVLPRYIRYIDERLQRLLSRYAARPNVLIVSDHGQGPTDDPTNVWRGFHTNQAIVLASGPSVAPESAAIRVSYYDILPTVLSLMGLNPPADAIGRSFLRSGTADHERR